ncbi:putative fused transcriptional regulator/phosphomethylpyrimidine kinase/putative transcriptional regulator [Halorubrum trapanicum]|uniref:Putative fused transcriptional regulator/phosphomethylpyrimidine kinase/putative transcriptional regulator n=1 Tax=Halorubrum trapanicum TaxID=29284 RepID=A0A8J7RDN3_9EURY|nr:thiamine-phosphate synthase family protein [Halorubrum trapanicum]MBP1902036.1 putative fused transcriptional regulator/phosphomethylpyrimidine kinase/putative transcriptional regulator [Halorubrum trapanicum]
MRFIEEVVVDEFLPTVRSMLAEDLRERGFTQLEVADALGISQSAVSKYAAGDVARHDRIVADERVRELVERVGEGLASGDLTPVAALVEIEVLIRQLEEGDLLADLHEDAMPALADADVEFSVHDPDSGLRERERVLTSVRRGLRTLTNASGFAGLIPNVGANVAESLADAATVDDVAAVPGRLVDVKGRAMVPGEPEFGVSEHVATVLLAAREAGADVRGAVNLRYEPETVETLGAAHPTVEFDAERPTREAVADAVAAADRSTDEDAETLVLYQTGAVGVEPIVYVLAPTAAEAARVVRGLL